LTSGTYNGGPPTAETTTQPYPIDYSKSPYFPACTTVGTAPDDCSATTGAPNYCTKFITGGGGISAISNGVYCAIGSGTGVSASNPATWNGTINVNGGSGTAAVTFIAGSVDFSSGTWNLSASQDNLLVYASNGGQPEAANAFQVSGGGITYSGNVFVPTGTAAISGGSGTGGTFIEADLITLSGGSLTGDGPTTSSGGTTPGTDSLTG
jgi:hypothetical protein